MDDRTRSIEERADEIVDPESERTAREIRSEIERTREGMSETVDAIQEKLRPSNVVASAASATTERVKDMAQDAASTASEWWDDYGGNRFIDKVRNNPVPAVMAGVGLAWLWMSNGQRRRGPAAWRSGAPRDAREERSNVAGDYSTNYDYQRGSYSSRDYSSRDYSPSEYGNGVRNRLSDAGRMMQQGRNRIECMVRQYPLAVGAAAVILGASLGAVVPETDKENELMGEAKENAMQRAQEAASGAVGRIKEAAADVVTRAAIGD
jgi:hypothetical protein